MANIIIMLIIFYFVSFSWLIAGILDFVFGYDKPMMIFMNVFDKETRDETKEKKEQEKERIEKERIDKEGTPEEKIEYYNKLFPDNQMLTDKEVKEKYKGLDFSKVIIVNTPNVIYNIDEQRVLNSREDLYEISNNILQLKSGNRNVSVDSYTSIQINELNKCNKIMIYREKFPTFRYKILDNIK